MPNRSQRDRIYAYIKRRPTTGVTRKELSRKLRILHQSVGPRVLELLGAGLVRESTAVRNDSVVLLPTARSR